MELAAAQGFDVRVVTLPPGRDPADLAGEFDELLGAPRATSPTACGWRSSARRPAGGLRPRARGALALRGLAERQDAVRLAADRLDLPKETQAGFAPGRGGRATGRSARACWRRAFGSSATRSPACRPSAAARLAGRALARPLRRRAAPPRAGAPARARRADEELVRCWPSSTRARPPRGSTRRPPRSSAPPARAPGAPRARERRPRAHERAPGAARETIRSDGPRTWRVVSAATMRPC
jgi:hypothetical protein